MFLMSCKEEEFNHLYQPAKVEELNYFEMPIEEHYRARTELQSAALEQYFEYFETKYETIIRKYELPDDGLEIEILMYNGDALIKKCVHRMEKIED